MQFSRPPTPSRELTLPARPIEIVLPGEGGERLDLVLPPLDELMEIKELREGNFSFRSIVESSQLRLQARFTEELGRFLEKSAVFGDSATFQNRAANLANLGGDLESEERFLREAKACHNDNFFVHRLGVNAAVRRQLPEAERIFRTLDLDRDALANVRLAYLAAATSRLSEADALVGNALELEPDNYRGRVLAGVLSIIRNDLRRAVQHFKFAIEIRPTASAQVNLAIAYIMLGRSDKAMTALRRAVALEPFSQNALRLFADLAFILGRDSEVVTPLRSFLEIEQTDASIWGRMARALLRVGDRVNALDALKRQASVAESSVAFNNMGVIHAQLGDKQRAARFFLYAMEKADDTSSNDYLLATRNFLAVSLELGNEREVLQAASRVLQADKESRVSRDKVLSDIYVSYVTALYRSGEPKAGKETAKRWFWEADRMHPRLRVWLASGLIADLGLDPQRDDDGSMVREALLLASSLDAKDPRRDMLKNNVAFFFLETGRLEEAERLLSQLNASFFKEAYPTATLGLFHFRRGHVERGKELYERAVRIAATANDKRRIAQKMNLELGRIEMSRDPREARKLLMRAAKDGEPVVQISKQATELLASLIQKKE